VSARSLRDPCYRCACPPDHTTTLTSLPDIRFHDLRHSAATLLLEKGIHPKIVSDMLGHSQVGITLNLYSHVTPTMQRQAAEAMDALLQ
jgi:integrase